MAAADRLVTESRAIALEPLFMGAVGAAALREVVEGPASDESALQWVAVSCLPEEEGSWQLMFAQPGRSATPAPLPLELASELIEVMKEHWGGDIDRPVLLSRLERRHLASTFGRVLEGEATYFRRSNLNAIPVLGDRSLWWLCGASRLLTETEEFQLNDVMTQAESIVADRVQHGLGGYRPIAAVLASVDDRFHAAMLRARSPREINKVLSRSKDDTSLIRASVVPQSAGCRVDEKLIYDRICALTRTIGLEMGEAATVQIDSGGTLRTPCGLKHAWVELPSGPFGVMSRRVTASVVTSRDDFDVAVAEYVREEERLYRNVEYVIFLGHPVSQHVGHFQSVWSHLRSLHIDAMPSSS